MINNFETCGNNRLNLLQRVLLVLIFPLFLFYEIYRMYPNAPIIPYPTPLIFLFFVLVLCNALLAKKILHKNFVFYAFTILNSLILYLFYIHSVGTPLANPFFYASVPLPIFLLLLSYNLTITTGNRPIPIVAVSFLFILALVYLINRNTNMALKDLLTTDMGSYVVLYFLPFVLCLKQRFWKCFFILLCLIAVLLSFKRGGTICLLSGIIVYITTCVMHENDRRKKRKLLFLSFFSIIFFTLVLFYINEFFDDYLFTRFSEIEEGGGSGRDMVYAQVIEMLRNSSWFELFFGHGWNTVLRDSYLGLSAHNDFLECIYDYGFITFFAYVLLYISLIKFMFSLLKRNSFYAAPFAASVAMFFLNSLVSHILLYDHFFMVFALFWGYIIACDENEKKELLELENDISEQTYLDDCEDLYEVEQDS